MKGLIGGVLLALSLSTGSPAKAVAIGPGETFKSTTSTFEADSLSMVAGSTLQQRDDGLATWFLGGPFDIAGGTVEAILLLDNFSSGSISGGTFNTALRIDRLATGGTMAISGGSFAGLVDISRYQGSVSISGGNFQGGFRASFSTTGGALPQMTLIGSNWSLGGVAIDFGDLGALNFASITGQLTGTLADGNSFLFNIGSRSVRDLTLVRVAQPASVPLPAGFPLLAAGLTLLFGASRGRAAVFRQLPA